MNPASAMMALAGFVSGGSSMTGKRSRASSTFSPQATDDFKLIKGIGLAVERRLHKAGIHSYAQLAALSADQIAARIGGLSAQRIIRENWIGQARQLAGPPATKVGSKKADIGAQSNRRKSSALGVAPQHYATFTVQLTLDQAGNVQRAVCTHHQSKDQETWNKNDWDETKLVNYVVRKAGLRRPQPSAAAPSAPPESTFPMPLTDQPILPRTPESIAAPVEAQVSPTLIDTTTYPVPGAAVASKKKELPAKSIPGEGESTRATGTGKAGSSEDTMYLSGLITIPANLDHSSRIFPAGTAFRVQLTADPTELKGLPDVPLDLVTDIYIRRLGGSQELIGQAREAARLTDTAMVQVECPGLSAGEYRLEAVVSLVRHSGGSQASDVASATLAGGFLHIY